MGSPGIGKLVREYASNAKQEKNYSDYTGHKLVIDLMIWLYRFKIAMINQPNIKSINVCLWSKIVNMLEIGILPIFVMDGRPPKFKKNALEKRKKIKDSAKSKLKELSDDDEEEKLKLMKRSVRITDAEIADATEFLSQLGFPVIHAPEEADSQCAGINKVGKAYGVVSEDWDTLIFGAQRMITNFSRRNTIIEYDRELVLGSLGLTKEQLVEVAIMLGCDYCDGISIQGGEKKREVYNLFMKYRQYGNLRNMLNGLKEENRHSRRTGIRYKIPSNLQNDWEEIKTQFIEAQIYDPAKMNFDWNIPDYSSLKNHFIKMDKKNVYACITKIRKYYQYYSEYGCLVNSKEKRTCREYYELESRDQINFPSHEIEIEAR